MSRSMSRPDFQSSLVAALFLGGTAFGAQVRQACMWLSAAANKPGHIAHAALFWVAVAHK